MPPRGAAARSKPPLPLAPKPSKPLKIVPSPHTLVSACLPAPQPTEPAKPHANPRWNKMSGRGRTGEGEEVGEMEGEDEEEGEGSEEEGDGLEEGGGRGKGKAKQTQKRNASSTGRKKIKIGYIDDKARRSVTFTKRKSGIMKKAYELSTLTGTQCLVVVVSESGTLYTFSTPRLAGVTDSPRGQAVISASLAGDLTAETPADEADLAAMAQARDRAASKAASPALATGPLPARATYGGEGIPQLDLPVGQSYTGFEAGGSGMGDELPVPPSVFQPGPSPTPPFYPPPPGAASSSSAAFPSYSLPSPQLGAPAPAPAPATNDSWPSLQPPHPLSQPPSLPAPPPLPSTSSSHDFPSLLQHHPTPSLTPYALARHAHAQAFQSYQAAAGLAGRVGSFVVGEAVAVTPVPLRTQGGEGVVGEGKGGEEERERGTKRKLEAMGFGDEVGEGEGRNIRTREEGDGGGSTEGIRIEEMRERLGGSEEYVPQTEEEMEERREAWREKAKGALEEAKKHRTLLLALRAHAYLLLSARPSPPVLLSEEPERAYAIIRKKDDDVLAYASFERMCARAELEGDIEEELEGAVGEFRERWLPNELSALPPDFRARALADLYRHLAVLFDFLEANELISFGLHLKLVRFSSGAAGLGEEKRRRLYGEKKEGEGKVPEGA
ncbi:hypothetical protein JCM8547_006974 [Rhodosporidiobolus lusitaniae]